MKIHETAFIVSTYRSYHEDISKDIYAKLWNNTKTELLIPSILKSISKDEAILHSLRNRFFYERINSFFTKNNGGTLINFGAGFSMYQFIIDDTVSTIEIDKREIIDYKKNKIDLWVDQNKLPYRETLYTAIDFNQKTEKEIIEMLYPLIKKKPTFILLEGVLFFLDQQTTNKLFRVFNKLQNQGDLVGVVSYLPEIEKTEVYQRLLNYFDTHNSTNDSFNHQTIATSYYKKIKGYRLQEHIDEFQLSKIYTPQNSFIDKTQLLNENMYILENYKV
ncbi:class I SAM-dependent methyltransferase [Aquimarina longa]|uniref:class I SAM-dependent methyltransferase n=1 Tax=Aquimarina longa TaxID=1080221 RepID=UPI0007816464|nr:class I SAM-dependent methyltransferase [Aquimarina longa]